jgi:hypothetical protein
VPAAPTSAQPTLASRDEELTPVPSPQRLLFARAVITLTAVVTLAAFATIIYRSVTVTEPTSAIVVEGDASFDGALILVTSTEYPAARATLTVENNYRTPVLLYPGIYTVLVMHRDRALFRDTFRIDAQRAVGIDLLKLAAQTRPSTSAPPPPEE